MPQLSFQYSKFDPFTIANSSNLSVLASVSGEDFLFTLGQDKLTQFIPTPVLNRYHCKKCGTFIVAEVATTKCNRNLVHLVRTFPLSLIGFEDDRIPDEWKPEFHQWYENRMFDCNDGLKHYAIYDIDDVSDLLIPGTYLHSDDNSLQPSLILNIHENRFSLMVKWAVEFDFTFKEIQYFGSIVKIIDNHFELKCTESQLNAGGCEECCKTIELDVDLECLYIRTRGKFGRLCSIANERYTLYHHKITH